MAAANENQWREFWQRLGAIDDPLQPWQRIHAAYAEVWRAYHNLEHIGHCLAEFAVVRQPANDSLAVEAAIWFHDVIYDTRKNDNEERSADFAVDTLRAAARTAEFCETVRALILATRHHAQPESNDARLLTDIDLSILGQGPDRYAEFEQQIRREYAWVTDKDFAAGRLTILNSFFQRKRIFNLPTFVQRYEEQARVNLSWAIKQLAA